MQKNPTISGYISFFNIIDGVNDIIRKRAFDGTDFTRIPVLWNHDTGYPIGRISKALVRRDGVWATMELFDFLPKSSEVISLLEAGTHLGLSIGYTTLDARYFQNPECRELISLKLREVSVVLFPANVNCVISSWTGKD